MYNVYVYKYRHLNADGKPCGATESIHYSYEQAENVEEAIFLLAECKAIEITDSYYYECYDDEYEEEA